MGPIYKLVSTNVGGERRFAAAVARRLQSLGALTRGDRQAASGIDLSESNFDSPLGRTSLGCILTIRYPPVTESNCDYTTWREQQTPRHERESMKR